jgi:hypothetical protein
MVRRCLSYNVIQLVYMVNTNYKKYKSYNDLSGLDTKHPPQYRTAYVSNPLPKYDKEAVSYSVFLQKYPHASKKQRVEAIKRFYDNLY